MKVLVVDDELQARKRIVNLLEDHSRDYIIKECSNGEEAILELKNFKPELVFLDVNLLDMKGFDVLKSLKGKTKPKVIFVTAYDAHAIKAFDYDAFDFLLKPYKDKRFYKALKKLNKLSKPESEQLFDKKLEEILNAYQSTRNSEPQYISRIPIKNGNKTVLLDTDNIHYICASGNYAEIFTHENKYLVRESLNSLSDNLDPQEFLRVHRSAIVKIDFIQEIIHSDYSEIDLKLKDNKLIRVSKSHKKNFIKQIGI